MLYPVLALGLTAICRGLLGYNSGWTLERRSCRGQGGAGAVDRPDRRRWTRAAIRPTRSWSQFAIAGGETAFKTNCAPCHGLGGAGQGFFPTLADDDWLWGGTLEQIEHTIRHGIRNGEDPDARDNAMPAFGADGLLTGKQIADVPQYVLSLTQRQTDAEAAERGATVFAENCASCHGEAGEGVAGARRARRSTTRSGSMAASPTQIVSADQSAAAGRHAGLAGPARRRDDQDADRLRPQPGRRRVAPGRARHSCAWPRRVLLRIVESAPAVGSSGPVAGNCEPGAPA